MARSLVFQVLLALTVVLAPRSRSLLGAPSSTAARSTSEQCAEGQVGRPPPLQAVTVNGAAESCLLATQSAGSLGKDDAYPAERSASVVRYYSLEGDVKVDGLRKAISELSTKEVESRIIGEPAVSDTRPGKHFIAVETPAAVTVADIEKALRKSHARATSLEWTLFRGAKKGPSSILGYSGQDCVIGMSGDLRWFEFNGGASTFFYVPGKLQGAKLEDLYRKLYQPLGGGDLGQLARDVIQWSLASPVDKAAAQRAEKAIAKLAGVHEAKLDPGTGSLRVVVDLDGLKTSGSLAGKVMLRVDAGGKVENGGPVSPRFDTNPILDVLAKEEIAIARRKD